MYKLTNTTERFPVNCACGGSLTIRVTKKGIIGFSAPCDPTAITLSKIADEKTSCKTLLNRMYRLFSEGGINTTEFRDIELESLQKLNFVVDSALLYGVYQHRIGTIPVTLSVDEAYRWNASTFTDEDEKEAHLGGTITIKTCPDYIYKDYLEGNKAESEDLQSRYDLGHLMANLGSGDARRLRDVCASHLSRSMQSRYTRQFISTGRGVVGGSRILPHKAKGA